MAEGLGLLIICAAGVRDALGPVPPVRPADEHSASLDWKTVHRAPNGRDEWYRVAYTTPTLWTGREGSGMKEGMEHALADTFIYDVAVIGAGPAGVQAAISAWHQGRRVLVLDAGAVSQRKGRAYWAKSVAIEDAPGLPPLTGPKLRRQLHGLLTSRASGEAAQPRIALVGAYVLQMRREGDVFAVVASLGPLRHGAVESLGTFRARRVVIASGFEDGWPEIEVEPGQRMLERHRTAFRYAGNENGWHLCIRCDGHLHRGGHFALLGVGDSIYEASLGAQDFASRITILTNGRPHGLSDAQLRQAGQRELRIDTRPIARHLGEGTLLRGVVFTDGEELRADGFLVDEGLTPNTQFLAEFKLARNLDGLLRTGEDGAALRADGQPEPGLYVAGDLVAGQRKLIAAAMASGQDAGLGASDSLREWQEP